MHTAELRWWQSVTYWFGISIASLLILGLFVTPVRRHAGINDHPGAGFSRMINGAADHPFRTRILLPAAITVVSRVVPDAAGLQVARFARTNPIVSNLFRRWHWEFDWALEYMIASVLMLGAFIGFAHYTALLAIDQCGFGSSPLIRGALAILALAGVPAFFRFTSFIYDPAQLLVFAGALYYLSIENRRMFLLFFILAALNKETALLLVPLAWAQGRLSSAGRSPVVTCAVLVGIYAAIRFPLHLAGPDARLEFHLLDHNLQRLAQGYGPVELSALLVLLAALTAGWKAKPEFLRRAAILLLIPLLMLSMLLGYVDEWRGYYEAYPACFGLVAHTGGLLLTLRKR